MKYQELRKKIKSPVFTSQDIRLLRGPAGGGAGRVFAYQLSLWQKQGYIIKLKNGVYAYADMLPEIMAEEISPALYGPSYISTEKALSFYGLIPEMVYAITSVTPRTTRRIKNKAGFFIYRQIKPKLYFGYKAKKGDRLSYLMAEPEKALLDLIYLNRINDVAKLDNLRINWKVAKKIFNKAKIRKYAAKYRVVLIGRTVHEIMRRI
ncbi:MAG: hypothetical protein V1843_01325 [bacterium]